MASEPRAPLPGGSGESEDSRQARIFGKYAGIGLQFAGSIVLFLYVGRWVDSRLGSDPWGLILGVFLGAGAAFFSMYRRLMADLRREEEARRR
jgi:F0F1-type ATP synthase assembly protein I